MPKREDIRKVLVIGSGPIVIGQAAEFDYSGTQACRALREEGVAVVLVNPNPATIMTDPNIADKVYLEPLTVQTLEEIIEKERPDGLIATMGGQAGLNLTVKLYDLGILRKFQVELLGTGVESIRKGEDRQRFKNAMISLGQPLPRSMVATRETEIGDVLDAVGLPCVVRPAFTLGGTGGGHAETVEELKELLERGLTASPIHKVLVESSLCGQKEIEFEVVRDGAGNAIAVCSMENIDPMGIHTGDSIVVAPALTLTDGEYQMLRKAALGIADGLDIEGACNVQFALKQDGTEYYVIEVNPRVSRSSALASKATGYPIARVAAKIALGFNLDEIPNEVTGKTFACHEPALDYVTVKIPRWPWDKFSGGHRELGLQMKSTGEVMAIARTFEEALGKGLSSLDEGKELWRLLNDRSVSREEILIKLACPDDTRIIWVLKALDLGVLPAEISSITGIDRFFIDRMARIVELERKVRNEIRLKDTCKNRNISRFKKSADGQCGGGHTNQASENPPFYLRNLLFSCKQMGLSDRRIADLLCVTEEEVRGIRESWGIKPVFKMVDTCAGEFGAKTPYYYSTYEEFDEVSLSYRETGRPSVVVLGGGPIRIGQGIEFDYCAVHAAWTLEKEGYCSIIINNNPETVSTDFNTASKLYFEPLTFEHVKAVLDLEKPLGVLVAFGGQTAINLVKDLDRAGVKIFGTSPNSIDITEDRHKFTKLLGEIGTPVIPGTAVFSKGEAVKAAQKIGFPLVVRPSYVLGGRAMAIVYNEEEFLDYLEEAIHTGEGYAILLDRYIPAKEVDVDVLSDGCSIYVPAIIEHVERSGVHSGDSIGIIPATGLSESVRKTIIDYTEKLCTSLKIKGIANIQYIVDGDTVYCLEVNPRASRTVPFVTKITGFPLISVATGLSLGRTLKSYGISTRYGPEPRFYAVKMPVFSWAKIPGVDPCVGPEMKSTGEVMGIGCTLEEAMLKGFVAQGIDRIGDGGRVLMTIADRDKSSSVIVAKLLHESGWKIYATRGTAAYLLKHGIDCEVVLKITETESHKGGPNIKELISAKGVDLVVNTYTKGGREERDGFKIRTLAAQKNIPVLTCLDTALAFAKAYSKKVTPGIVALPLS